ncbi:fimbrillin family protein [Bacteroides uniformis]|nr:fimbrillin family protein [Bacteroides uniformis]
MKNLCQDGESNSIFITSYPIDYYAYYPYATVDNPLEFTFHVAADQESLTESDDVCQEH